MDEGLEDSDFVIVDGGVELDLYLFLRKEWAAMERGCAVVYLQEADRDAESGGLECIGAVRLDGNADVLAELTLRLTSELVCGSDNCVPLNNAISILKEFIADGPVFIYDSNQEHVFLRHMGTTGEENMESRTIDASNVALFTWTELPDHSLETVADHLHSHMASFETTDYVAVIVKLLRAARGEAKARHSHLSTFPSLRIPKFTLNTAQ